MKMILPIFSAILLTACGSADNDPGPGGVSVGEARALDEAAEMVEAKRLPQQEPETEPEADTQPQE
ncbi:hypothetical protein [Pontixanthobacter aquaemixtae]|uniref:Uncharacterized protein n=1 Tax=Pontixanthobacter aquaemixtae TaxID=1958940 RepID=A0A844ZXW7_9SPHN|nr:hypothetical protein [Pontixanthobacter aquaemixtae]MXO91597.1 hypothetical protein [Pontixanthobacter aquaemixtae]